MPWNNALSYHNDKIVLKTVLATLTVIYILETVSLAFLNTDMLLKLMGIYDKAGQGLFSGLTEAHVKAIVGIAIVVTLMLNVAALVAAVKEILGIIVFYAVITLMSAFYNLIFLLTSGGVVQWISMVAVLFTGLVSMRLAMVLHDERRSNHVFVHRV